jgi:hypothetical protein
VFEGLVGMIAEIDLGWGSYCSTGFWGINKMWRMGVLRIVVV